MDKANGYFTIKYLIYKLHCYLIYRSLVYFISGKLINFILLSLFLYFMLWWMQLSNIQIHALAEWRKLSLFKNSPIKLINNIRSQYYN